MIELNSVEKQNLETLIMRKRKADSMPAPVREKYKKEYDLICTCIKKLEKKQREKAALNYFGKVQDSIARLDWGTHKEFDSFFNGHPEHMEKINNMLRQIDIAFEKDDGNIKNAIDMYGKTCLCINKEFQNTKKLLNQNR